MCGDELKKSDIRGELSMENIVNSINVGHRRWLKRCKRKRSFYRTINFPLRCEFAAINFHYSETLYETRKLLLEDFSSAPELLDG